MRLRPTSLSFIVGLFVGAITIICYTYISGDERVAHIPSCSNPNSTSARQLKCLIEGRRKIDCFRDESDVFLPFNRFIRKQFDVYGRILGEGTKNERFEYYTSYSKSKRPDIRNYSSVGVFGNFGTFSVEKRDRVRCINGRIGLPMSCQWHSKSYFYPIQVAQFGLQHYSRLLTDLPPQISLIEKNSIASTSIETPTGEEVVLKDASDFVVIKLVQNTELPIVLFEWLPESASSSFIFIVEDVETKRNITLNYQFSSESDECLWSANGSAEKSTDFIYSLGAFSEQSSALSIIRDINVDALKALALHLQSAKKKDPLADLAAPKTEQLYRPMSLLFRGAAQIKFPLRQQSSAHREMFLLTADWLVRNQASTGGWQVPVARELSGIKQPLKPGWISAMGQGHGLSVLVRAFNLTGDSRYEEAAAKALHPFEVEAVDGGVRNHLFGLPWYEEYPTRPPSLVLNGFIYSLIGLYDMSTSSSSESAKKARQLFEAGLDSLRTLLPFYDTGRGSTYDLKHATSKVTPNIARPDYHKAHVYLLKWLYVITGERLFDDVSSRWFGYSVGMHAKING